MTVVATTLSPDVSKVSLASQAPLSWFFYSLRCYRSRGTVFLGRDGFLPI